MTELALIVAIVAALVSGGVGFKLGMDHQQASEIDKREVVAEAVDAATNAAAEAIAKLAPKYTTIHNKLEREIETHTVYADCRLTPDGLLLANQALSGGKPAVKGELPKADAVAK